MLLGKEFYNEYLINNVVGKSCPPDETGRNVPGIDGVDSDAVLSQLEARWSSQVIHGRLRHGVRDALSNLRREISLLISKSWLYTFMIIN